MDRVVRTILHGALLGLLAVGTVDGLVMLVGYLVMLAMAAAGWMPITDAMASQVALGALMVVLWGGVIIAGLRALAQQGRHTVALARWVNGCARPASPPLATAAAQAGVAASVVEVPDRAPYAFTYGIWHPRIVVSSALVETVTQAELDAVVRHEGSHVRNRDPLKVLALRTWAAALFFLPLVGVLFQRILDRQELTADRVAQLECGVSPVAGALLKTAGEPTIPAGGSAVAAMGGPTLLEARVVQLETGRRPRLVTGIRPSAVVSSLPGVGMLATYGVVLYQVCLTVQHCCMS